MGKGLVDEFRNEFNIEDQWLPYELQPKTPPEGRRLTDKFLPHEITSMFNTLRQRGRRYNMFFNDHNLSFNSHLALLAGEVAQDMGKFEKFHENIFKAFFTDHKNIGQLGVILDIVAATGMDREIFTESLNRNRYETRLKGAATEAARLGIRSIPAFVFEEDEIIFGALSPDIFHETLKRIQKRTSTNPFM